MHEDMFALDIRWPGSTGRIILLGRVLGLLDGASSSFKAFTLPTMAIRLGTMPLTELDDLTLAPTSLATLSKEIPITTRRSLPPAARSLDPKPGAFLESRIRGPTTYNFRLKNPKRRSTNRSSTSFRWEKQLIRARARQEKGGAATRGLGRIKNIANMGVADCAVHRQMQLCTAGYSHLL